MSEQPEKDSVVRQWLEKADHDIRAAETILTVEDNCPLDTVCFHAQQCVEKCVKALLAHLSIDFPKSHDLGELVELLPDGTSVPLSLDEQEQLTDYATATRCPGDLEPIVRDDAKHAVAAARRAQAAAAETLSTQR